MGTQTNFIGKFAFDREPSLKVYLFLKKLCMMQPADLAKIVRDHGFSDPPDSYCQWIPDDNGEAIVWNGSEKFYKYIEWIRWIIDNLLKPSDITISGRVEWSGEDVVPMGVIYIIRNEVEIKTIKSEEEKIEHAIEGLTSLLDEVAYILDSGEKELYVKVLALARRAIPQIINNLKVTNFG